MPASEMLKRFQISFSGRKVRDFDQNGVQLLKVMLSLAAEERVSASAALKSAYFKGCGPK